MGMTGMDIQSLGESGDGELVRAIEISPEVRLGSAVNDGYGRIFGDGVGEPGRMWV
jgi:hypothetical protein